VPHSTYNPSRSRLAAVAALGLIFLFAPTPGWAQITPGVQAGVSLNPDQIYVGAHVETTPLFERIVFRPNLEIGFGDHVTLTSVNLEFVWKFPPSGSPWAFYAGAGPAINVHRVAGPGDDAKAGFNFVGGAENSRGFFFEFKVGVDGSPDFRFGVGMTFR
jgi:hypothetical protein